MIHDASLGHGNVDHIVIGPPGVFTVETKSHPGPMRVARVHGATLSQARAQSARDRARHGPAGRAADRLQPRLGRPARRRAGAACACCPRGCSSATSPSAQPSCPSQEIDEAHELIAQALLEHEARAGAAHERWQLIR